MGIFGATKQYVNQYVDLVDKSIRATIGGMARTMELQGVNIAKAISRTDTLADGIVETRGKMLICEALISANTAKLSELVDAVARLSADLAEIDKRVCALEVARTQGVFETANLTAKKFPAARGAEYEIGDVHDATVQKPAHEPKPDRTRVSTKDVASTIMRIDKDALYIAARAKAEFVRQRVINACIAAGVVTALRFNGKHVISVTTHDREDARPNRTRFYASVRPEGEAQARQVWVADEKEVEAIADEMAQFVQITRSYFGGRKP